jgi:hypothetical protein
MFPLGHFRPIQRRFAMSGYPRKPTSPVFMSMYSSLRCGHAHGRRRCVRILWSGKAAWPLSGRTMPLHRTVVAAAARWHRAFRVIGGFAPAASHRPVRRGMRVSCYGPERDTRFGQRRACRAGEPHESRLQAQSRMGIRDRGGRGDHSSGRRRGDDIFVDASAGSCAASAGGRIGRSAHLGCARGFAADSRHTGRGATTDGTTGGEIACGSASYPALGRVARSRCVGG